MLGPLHQTSRLHEDPVMASHGSTAFVLQPRVLDWQRLAWLQRAAGSAPQQQLCLPGKVSSNVTFWRSPDQLHN